MGFTLDSMPTFDNVSDQEASEILRTYYQLYGNRGVWEQHWQEIAERIDTQASWSFQNNFRTAGEKRTKKLFDSTGALSLGRFASICDSLLTPRNSKWSLLAAHNPILKRNRSVQLYFDQVNQLLFDYRYGPHANFAGQNQMVYTSLGAYGTASMFIDKLAGSKGIRYRQIFLGELYLRENHQKQVDSVFRHFKLTCRQAWQMWGDALPDMIAKEVKVYPDMEFDFLHYVGPNTEYEPGRKDAKGKRYKSRYLSLVGGKILEYGGYNTFPYATTRYMQSMNETYGRSPAMEVLPSLKTLNEMKKDQLTVAHRAINPVLLAHDDGIMNSFNLTPGAVNYGGVTDDGRPLIHTLPVGDHQVTKEAMLEEQTLIKDAFFVNIFQILTETPEMTATEVMERVKEKGILLAPTIGRQEAEYLGPLIERELDVLNMQGLLPPMPQFLKDAEGEYKVEFQSPLSRAQRAEEASGLMRSVQTALEIAQATQDSSYLDYYNWDTIIPEVSEISGTPAHWMRDQQAVMQIRQARAKAAQQQQMIQAAPAMAAVAKAVPQLLKGGPAGGQG